MTWEHKRSCLPGPHKESCCAVVTNLVILDQNSNTRTTAYLMKDRVAIYMSLEF